MVKTYMEVAVCTEPYVDGLVSGTEKYTYRFERVSGRRLEKVYLYMIMHLWRKVTWNGGCSRRCFVVYG